jgi:hypothetical protein
MEKESRSLPLLLVALFGLVVPNGLFLYWLAAQFEGISEVLRNTLAISFILDALLAVGLLGYRYAKRPIGPYRWFWFVGLSLAGGLSFGIPFYWWLNRRTS